MRLWRINLKPGSEQGVDAAEFCISREIVGIGWRADNQPTTKEDYWKRAKELYLPKYKRGWAAAAKALLYRMAEGDLIWTRNRTGVYFLGRIDGEWRHDVSDDHAKADIVNLRKCRWSRVGTMDNVPGAVINAFRPSATVQCVSDASAALYSEFLFAQLNNSPLPTLKGNVDVLRLMSADDLEDVVAVYLQTVKRCIMFPSTCKTDTMTVECVFSSLEDGQRIGLQVKSGNTPLSRDGFATFDGVVYLFAACGQYFGQPNNRCICLEPEVIRQFVYSHKQLMPGRIQRWMDFAATQSNS